MPKDHPDPMRYIPTQDELKAAYAAEPPCHHLSDRLLEREVEAAAARIDQAWSELIREEGFNE